MDMERSNGITDLLAIKASSTKARKMDRAGSIGKMEVIMRVSFKMASSKASGLITSQILTRHIKVSLE